MLYKIKYYLDRLIHSTIIAYLRVLITNVNAFKKLFVDFTEIPHLTFAKKCQIKKIKKECFKYREAAHGSTAITTKLFITLMKNLLFAWKA